MSERSAIVVGGGIGGLAAGIGLIRRGWLVRIFERAAEVTEVGAAISLWSNALRALDALGIGPAVRALGVAELHGGIQHPSGRWLSRTDASEVIRRYGPVILLHRAELRRVLLDATPPGALVTGTEVAALEADGHRVRVSHPGGTDSADLLVGADGLRSTVRRLCWPDAPAPRYAGYTAWRLVTMPMRGVSGDGGETWGPGSRFGRATLPDRRVYCYATANLPEGAAIPGGDLAELRRRFGDWHDPIPELLAAAEGTTILRHDIYELPGLRSFVTGRVALLGDAAHAMTPDLGQGACQALEDAATLAAVLDEEPSVAAALARYDGLRRDRTQSIVRRSRRMGAVGQWQSRPAVALRDRLLPLVPASTAIRALAPVLDWPPAGGITGG
jgi:2-polyprenyl-6-methoxyphenol hydroxylase-like FAD-dependent oxidoreductase